jgi:hypothetical protein
MPTTTRRPPPDLLSESERLLQLAAHQWARVRRLKEGLPEKPRPQLILIRGGKDDDA